MIYLEAPNESIKSEDDFSSFEDWNINTNYRRFKNNKRKLYAPPKLCQQRSGEWVFDFPTTPFNRNYILGKPLAVDHGHMHTNVNLCTRIRDGRQFCVKTVWK